MGFPSNLVTRTTSESDGRDPFGAGTVLMLVGAFFVSAAVTGFFCGFAAYVAMRTYRAFTLMFPGP